MAEREGFEPGGRPNEISKLLIISRMLSPRIPSKPQIWHRIWHLDPFAARVAVAMTPTAAALALCVR
jgi:hypothetical protein